MINRKDCFAISDDEEEFHQKILCVNSKKRLDAMFVKEKVFFYFHFMKTGLFLFSGRKFSSSSLLKILFGLQITFLMVTGIVFEMLQIFEALVGKLEVFRTTEGKLLR